MTLATALHDVGDARRPALPIEAALQNVASAAHLRGVEVTHSGVVVGTVSAGELMRALRGAWMRKRDTDRADQVETIIRAVAARIVQPGPVQVSRQSFNIARGYAAGKRGRG